MKSRAIWLLLAAMLMGLLYAGVARAENEGQDDLDKATEAKLSAENLTDLGEVVRLCQSALKAGLDEANTKFANQLLVSCLDQRAEMICVELFERPNPPALWQQMRQMALGDLEIALKMDPDQPRAQYMVGRLHSLPGGDRKRALDAFSAAVKLSEKSPAEQSRALVMRGNITEDSQKRLEDYDLAIKLAPHSSEAHRARGLHYLLQNKFEDSLADIDAALQQEPKAADLYQAKGLDHFFLKNLDAALEDFDKAIEVSPNMASVYMHRARVYAVKGDNKTALRDLDKALELDPQALLALILRARVHSATGDNTKALADVQEALRQQPGLITGLEMRAALSAGMGKFDQAIEDLEQLRQVAPKDVGLLLQLAIFHTAAKHTQKALDTFTQVLEQDDKNWMAYRGRGDAYLNVGNQAEAAADYETALKLQPQESGILNNLAWLLATSPDEKIRDGKRAIELATEACKVTEYKQAHILSTLAAGYAETGDFDKAMEWSKKAVALGTGPMKKQLAKELESYQERKPWREATPEPVEATSAEDPSPEDAVPEEEPAEGRAPAKPDDAPEDVKIENAATDASDPGDSAGDADDASEDSNGGAGR